MPVFRTCRQKDKNHSPSAKNPIGTWYFTSAHNFNTILIINYLELTGARTKFANQNVGTCLWHVFATNRKLSTHHPTCRRHVPTLWRYRFEKFDTTSYQEIILSLGFFAVKRRAVFILGAMWWALVRGWRRDCVVGGMETRFQWSKAHSPSAKCEAFHVAPRLFFMFLFLIPFTIR